MSKSAFPAGSPPLTRSAYLAEPLCAGRVLKNSASLPKKNRRNKKTDEEKLFKNKELDQAREKTRINIRASFQRWRELQDL